MRIVLTGSLGHIGRPLTEMLVKKNHDVTVISSKAERKESIEAIGAKAAIGSVRDIDFLTSVFKGADVVYTMVPPDYNGLLDIVEYYRVTGSNYAQAIKNAGVKRIVNLSSFGAHLEKGSGLILGAHKVQNILNGLEDIDITTLRPTYFYYNLFGFVDMIKTHNAIAANYGADDKIILVSPRDIASAIAEEIEVTPVHRKIRYVASDERTGHEIASVLGAAIGKPDLKWVLITDDEMQSGMEAEGIPKGLVDNLIEMYSCMHSGKLAEDYYKNKPSVMGKVKLDDFAKDFKEVFLKD